MKTIYGVLAIFLFSFCDRANAQYVTIPDSLFRSQLIVRYPGCFNSAGQMDTTCSAIVNEDTLQICYTCGMYPMIYGNGIRNINGLQYFKKLNTFAVRADADEVDTLIIPKFPAKLKNISFVNIPIDTITDNYLPDSLVSFYCVSYQTIRNNLKSLPPLPATLTYLNFQGSKITALPTLPASLKYLNYSGSKKLTSLPTLPNGLQYLDCSLNFLTNLPTLPNGLVNLICTYSIIDTLPILPDSLKYLSIYSNKFLTHLTSLPNGLKELQCTFDSSLTSLPKLPDSLTYLDIQRTKIACLPVLPNNLEKLYFDRNVTMCIPNMNNNIVAQYAGNLPALCNATNNVNGCTAYPVIAGYAFYDANSNGVKEANEFYRRNTKLQLSNGNISFANDSGYYEIGTTTLGQYTLTPSNTFFNVTPTSKTISFSSYDTTIFQNFAYSPTAAAVDSMEISLSPFNWKVTPGGYFEYRIDVRNVGSGNFGITTIKVNYDNTKLTFNTASNVAVVNSGNTLTLNLPSFPIGGFVSFNIEFTGKTNLTLGDSLMTISTVSSGTHIVSDSALTYVASSWDPNDKTATPKLSPAQVVSGKYIDYIIRYQNTGNATAYNVVVADTLSSQLQANTLEMVSTSHNTKTTIIGNAVSFEMRNILLPASSANEVKSHGFIRFRIKPKTTLVLGDSVKNKAAIYFDYNSPVITNTAVTKIKNESTLPLKLLSFKGNKNSESNIHLFWSTANEINTKLFAVEQSTNSREFAAIGNVKANGYGNNNYSFDVTNPAKVDLFFRLKMIDKDGAFSYSSIVLIKEKTSNAGFVLLENPVKKEMLLISIAPSLINTEAVLVNNLGVVVRRFVIRSATQTVAVNDLTNGVYYLKTIEGSEKVVIGR